MDTMQPASGTEETARWRLFLIGTVRLEGPGGSVDRLRTRAAMALLVYLLLHRRRSHGRDELCDRFWPEDDLDSSRQKLRLALFSIRQAFPALIEADRSTVRVASPEEIWCDYEDVVQSLSQARASLIQDRLPLLEKTLTLCAGSLMPGYYEDWVMDERNRAESAAITALTELVQHYSTAERWSEALPAAQALAQLDPYQEVAHLAILHGLTALGRTRAIERHLAWIEELFEGIATPIPNALRGFSPAVHPPGQPIGARAGLEERFIGRDLLLNQVLDMLTAGTIITLWGPAGIGKSRLARELAEEARRSERAVYEIEAINAKTGEELESLILRALAGGDAAGDRTFEELVQSQDPALLILDNIEQIVETGGREVLERLASLNPELRVIATSQRKLATVGELVVPIPPLDVPSPDVTDVALVVASPSVRLLIEHSRVHGGRLAVTKENASALATLARELEGNPLALELAGEWLRWLSPADVLHEHRRSLRALASRHPDRMDRHRSLEAAIMTSFSRLPAPLHSLICRASIFRGGWDLDSAEKVCGVEDAASAMAELRDRSLVYSPPGGPRTRFAMLDSVHAYAAASLPESEWEGLRSRHADYFAQTVQRFAEDKPEAIVSEVAPDLENLRSALDTLEELGDPVRLGWVTTHATQLYVKLCMYEEAIDRLNRALHLLPASPILVRARVIHWIGTTCYYKTNYAEAEKWYLSAAEIYGDLGDQLGLARMTFNVGLCRNGLGDWAGAFSCLQKAYDLRGNVTPSNAAIFRQAYGDILVILGREAEGFRILQENLEECLRLDLAGRLGTCCAVIGDHLRYVADYDQAEPYIRRSIEYFVDLGEPQRIVAARGSLACLLASTERLPEARDQLREALELLPPSASSLNLVHCAEAATFICLAEGDLRRAYGYLALMRGWLIRSGEVFVPKHEAQLAEVEGTLAGAVPERDRYRLEVEAKTKTRRQVVEALREILENSASEA